MDQSLIERNNPTSTDVVFTSQEIIEILASLAPTLSEEDRSKLDQRRIEQIIGSASQGVIRSIEDVHTLVDTIVRHNASTSTINALIKENPGFDMGTVAVIYEARRDTGLNNIAGLAEIRTIVGEEVFNTEEFQAVLADRIRLEAVEFELRSKYIETDQRKSSYLSGKAARFATLRVVSLLDSSTTGSLSYIRVLEDQFDDGKDDEYSESRFGSYYDHDQ